MQVSSGVVRTQNVPGVGGRQASWYPTRCLMTLGDSPLWQGQTAEHPLGMSPEQTVCCPLAQ